MTTPPPIPPHQAAALLLVRRPDLARHRGQRRRAQALVGSLGGHVAAVQVLAAWLARRPEADVGDLDKLLDDRLSLAAAGMAPGPTDPSLPPRVGLAFDLAWERLQGHGPREVLRVLVLGGPGAIARPLLEEAAASGRGSVDDVLDAGFARQDDDERLDLDPDVRRYVIRRDEADPGGSDRAERWISAVSGHLLRARLEDADADSAAERAMDLAVRRGRPDVAGALALRSAERLRRRGARDAAGARAEAGIDLLDRGDPRHPLRGLLELELAMLALQAGKPDAALGRLERADSALLDAGLPTTPPLRRARGAVEVARAQALALLGRRREAERLLHRALQRLESAASPTDEVTLRSAGADEAALRRTRANEDARLLAARHALGLLRLRAGALDEAGAILRSVHEEWPQVAGGGSDGAATSIALASALRRSREHAEVGPLLEEARVLAGGDMDRPAAEALPLALHELGVDAADRGDLEAAATLLDEAAMLAGSLLPADHPLLPTITHTRGLLFLASGQRDQALAHLEKAGRRREQLLPPDHPQIALSRAALAWARGTQGPHRHKAARRTLATTADHLATIAGDEDTAVVRIRELAERLR